MNQSNTGRGRAFTLLLRCLVGGAFLLAGALKIADPAKFAQDVANYRLAPPEWINLVAILLPWIEVTTGFFLLAGVWVRAAALVIVGLSSVFLAVILSALARGLNIECGCFGTVGGKHVGLVNLGIDSVLLCLAVWLFRRSGPEETGGANATSEAAKPREHSADSGRQTAAEPSGFL